MEAEAAPPVSRRALLWAWLTPGLLLPLLAQVLLLGAGMLAGMLRLGDRGALFLAVGAVVLSGGLGWWQGRRAPARWSLRYAPVVAVTLLLWVIWALEMHVTAGDFTRRGIPSGYLPLLPWLGLAFLAGLTGEKWLMLLLPSVAYAVYAIAIWRASRDRPLERSRAWIPAAAVLAGLAVVIGWQMQQRHAALVPLGVKGESLQEEVDLDDYRPFVPNNKLVAIASVNTPALDMAQAPRLDGATAAYPLYAAMAQAFYTRQAADRHVSVSRTATAYERLIKGEVDAIFVAQPSKAHEEMARRAGVQLQLTPIAREAFVLLVHEANPVRGLSSEQVRAIYTGRIARWSEVGGADERILAFQRPPNSGSQTVMQTRVMRGEAMRKPMEEEVAQGMGGLVRRVAAYRNAPHALGYSFRYYATRMRKPEAVRLLAIDGVAPTRENVRSGAYPYTVDVFMVTTDRSRPASAQLRDWLLSPQGQKLVEDVGYVRR